MKRLGRIGLVLGVLETLTAEPGVYLLSVACWVVFAAVAMPHPRSVTYSALVVMWSLGFPLKLALHLWVGYPYQEPTGDFVVPLTDGMPVPAGDHTADDGIGVRAADPARGGCGG